MNVEEQPLFLKLQEDFKLLRANWYALKSNPPCEKVINEKVASINTMLEKLKQIREKYEYYNRKNLKGRINAK